MGGKRSRNSSTTVLHGSRSIVSNSRLSVYTLANPADTKFSRENVLRLTEQHAGVATDGEIVSYNTVVQTSLIAAIRVCSWRISAERARKRFTQLR